MNKGKKVQPQKDTKVVIREVVERQEPLQNFDSSKRKQIISTVSSSVLKEGFSYDAFDLDLKTLQHLADPGSGTTFEAVELYREALKDAMRIQGQIREFENKLESASKKVDEGKEIADATKERQEELAEKVEQAIEDIDRGNTRMLETMGIFFGLFTLVSVTVQISDFVSNISEAIALLLIFGGLLLLFFLLILVIGRYVWSKKLQFFIGLLLASISSFLIGAGVFRIGEINLSEVFNGKQAPPCTNITSDSGETNCVVDQTIAE